jgi:hypothetical protein
MKKSLLLEIILSLFVMIGFLSMLELAFELMNAASTLSFAVGVTILVISFLAAWLSITALWREPFKEFFNQKQNPE